MAVDTRALVKIMTRNLSNACFGLALIISLLMKLFVVQAELIWLAVFSVAVSAILTNLMRIRFIGIAGIGGLSMVYSQLSSSSLPGTILTALTTALLVMAVLLITCIDLSQPLKNDQGDEKNEVQFWQIF
jgi:hypothetical protein